MSKSKLVVFSLMAAALLCWQILPTSVDTANSGIVHPCSSTATIATGGACVLSCPFGDGTLLTSSSAIITLTVKDAGGAPVVGVPAGDVWLIGCADGLVLCGGSGSSNADQATDVTGTTTISGSLAVGGCDTGVKVVVQNTIIANPLNCAQDLCLAMEVRSPDINGDLTVDTIDFGLFGLDYPYPCPFPLCNPAKTYEPCIDYNCGIDIDNNPPGPGPEDIIVGVVDFGLYGLHHYHDC
jgi:phage baseplate assembly protein gpV